jgi:hypothetical protein
MEIGRNIRHIWEFKARSKASIVRILPSERVSVIRRATGGDFGSPVCAPASTTITMARPDIITTSTHVVYDCISINADTSSTAGLN